MTALPADVARALQAAGHRCRRCGQNIDETNIAQTAEGRKRRMCWPCINGHPFTPPKQRPLKPRGLGEY